MTLSVVCAARDQETSGNGAAQDGEGEETRIVGCRNRITITRSPNEEENYKLSARVGKSILLPHSAAAAELPWRPTVDDGDDDASLAAAAPQVDCGRSSSAQILPSSFSAVYSSSSASTHLPKASRRRFLGWSRRCHRGAERAEEPRRRIGQKTRQVAAVASRGFVLLARALV